MDDDAKKVEDEQKHLGALEDTFQQIKNTTGLAGVGDIIDRCATSAFVFMLVWKRGC